MARRSFIQSASRKDPRRETEMGGRGVGVGGGDPGLKRRRCVAPRASAAGLLLFQRRMTPIILIVVPSFAHYTHKNHSLPSLRSSPPCFATTTVTRVEVLPLPHLRQIPPSIPPPAFLHATKHHTHDICKSPSLPHSFHPSLPPLLRRHS